MLRFIRNLFKNNATTRASRLEDAAKPAVDYSSDSRKSRVSDAYFETMSRMQKAISSQEFEEAARLVRENLQCIPDWVKETCHDYDSFDISSVPALQQGGTVLALVGDDEGLEQMREVVSSTPELEQWVKEVEQHQLDRRLFEVILKLVTDRPNCLQTEVKGFIGVDDGRKVANLISYLDKAGKIARVKSGRTYRILPPDSPEIPKPAPKRIIRSHRTDREPAKLREIDVSALDYVPLPRAPRRWDDVHANRKQATALETVDLFEVRDADWKIEAVDKIPLAQRPDTAFRQMHPTDSGLIMIDDLGKADGLGQLDAAALRYGRTGKLAAKKALKHGVYRLGVHPFGRGLIAMSRDCVVHVYDDHLDPTLETPLMAAPEILALRKRFEIPDDQLKNRVRCVALSRDASRYLFTAVDEAWCVDMSGRGLWGTKLPLKDGWARVATPSSEFGTSADVDRALDLLGLSLPITPENLKRRYRELAKRWHPDLHPDDPKANEKMKELTVATGILTGIEASALPHYTGATFVRELKRMDFDKDGVGFTVSIGMEVDELHAADWVYAAGFAAASDAVYLAGYSGRVVLVDENGEGVRVYDVGSVPHKIVDTGDYLYLLTNTRLYVLHDDELHAVVDTTDGGDLFVAQTAFGLLEQKRLRWFREDGRYMGGVVSRDPIRRVYANSDGMILETRQRRAIVQGVSTWWE